MAFNLEFNSQIKTVSTARFIAGKLRDPCFERYKRITEALENSFSKKYSLLKYFDVLEDTGEGINVKLPLTRIFFKDAKSSLKTKKFLFSVYTPETQDRFWFRPIRALHYTLNHGKRQNIFGESWRFTPIENFVELSVQRPIRFLTKNEEGKSKELSRFILVPVTGAIYYGLYELAKLGIDFYITRENDQKVINNLDYYKDLILFDYRFVAIKEDVEAKLAQASDEDQRRSLWFDHARSAFILEQFIKEYIQEFSKFYDGDLNNESINTWNVDDEFINWSLAHPFVKPVIENLKQSSLYKNTNSIKTDQFTDEIEGDLLKEIIILQHQLQFRYLLISGAVLSSSDWHGIVNLPQFENELNNLTSDTLFQYLSSKLSEGLIKKIQMVSILQKESLELTRLKMLNKRGLKIIDDQGNEIDPQYIRAKIVKELNI